MTQGLYVEFAGVAGSGKTEAMALLERTLRARAVPVSSRTPFKANPWLKFKLVLRLIMFACANPSLILLAFARPSLEYAGTPHIRKTISDLAFRALIDRVVINYLRKCTNGLFLNDEGQVGKAVSLAVLLGLSKERAASVASKLLPQASTVVLIETSPETALTRLESRTPALPFFANMNLNLKKNFFESATAIYPAVLEQLEKRGHIRVICAKNNGNREELGREIEKVADMLV